jgi:ATP synthase protein I
MMVRCIDPNSRLPLQSGACLRAVTWFSPRLFQGVRLKKKAILVPASPPAISSAPIRAVLRWQAILTIACAAGAYFWLGLHGGLSALLGGFVNASAVIVYWFVANLGLEKSRAVGVGTGLWPLLRAEIVKIVCVVVQIVILFTTYPQLHHLAFLVVFVVTLLAWRVSFAAQSKLEANS